MYPIACRLRQLAKSKQGTERYHSDHDQAATFVHGEGHPIMQVFDIEETSEIRLRKAELEVEQVAFDSFPAQNST
jgi:hypothetical protein